MIQKLKEVLTTKGMREAGFPAKVSLPLYLGVFAVVTFDNCKIYDRGVLEPELFLVNPNYTSSKRMRKVKNEETPRLFRAWGIPLRVLRCLSDG